MITLSSVTVDPASGIRRDSLRPEHLRNAQYADHYDWDTLFYDVYRVGKHVVMQGPPLLNFLPHVRHADPLRRAFGFPFFAAQHFGQHKRGEIWLRTEDDHIDLDCALGRFHIAVQSDNAPLFAGRRVITSLSKDNDLRWIADWVRFYRRVHGAQGVLVYDNNSTAYTLAELQATLDEASEGEMTCLAVNWPFRYGPQGGLAGAVNGVEPDWDSDFCQTGSLQHARFRFLRHAASVLNVDVDELVLPVDGQSIFTATEASPQGFIKFPGLWIGTHAAPDVTRETCRHADYLTREWPDRRDCPPKWCVVPGRGDKRADSWSVHNLFGARANKQVHDQFVYRHFRAITTSWKEDRWQDLAVDPAGPWHDAQLADALKQL